MQARQPQGHRRRRWGLVLVVALLLAGCGDDTDAEPAPDGAPDDTGATTTDPEPADPPTDDDPTGDDPPPLTASWRGVTETEITVGFAPTDNAGINELFAQDFAVVPSPDMITAWTDAVNAAGGINGRTIVPVIEPVIPIGEYVDEACLELTEDVEVFVIVGALSSDTFLCFTEGAGIPYVGEFGETPDRQERSGGLLFAAEMSQIDSRTGAVQLMIDDGVFDGRRVGLWWESPDGVYEEAVRPLLDEAGVDIVADAALAEFGTDTVDIRDNIRLTLEKFRSEDVDLILNLSDVRSLLTLLDEIGYEVDVALVSGRAADRGDVADIAASPEVKARTFAITVEKPDLAGWLADDGVRGCLEVYDAAFPDAPIDLTAIDEVRRFALQCRTFDLTMRILEAAGPDLTPDTFVAGAESLGSFSLPGMADARLGPDKHSAGNELRRYEFDPELGWLEAVGDPISLDSLD